MQTNAILSFTPPSSAFLFHPLNPKLSISSNLNAIPRRRWLLCVAGEAAGVPRRRWPICAASAPATTPSCPAGGGDLLDISKLGIAEQIVTSLSRRGITELFPIQRAVLEPAMEGRDMIGRAITGSGKTLAFGIPILDKIIRQQNQSRTKRVPSALVLAPTRELARQVQREFQISAPILQSTCIYGGISIMNQVSALRGGMDIVVGTPGRIIDLVGRGDLDLSEVKFVVLDEADQMLAVGFQDDVETILSYLPTKKQCMLFSATMPPWINDLSRKYLRNPLLVDLVGNSDQKLAEGISLYSVSSTTPNKQNLLPTLISMYAQGGKSIIFTKTKRDAESLSRSMGVVIGSKALHGDMQQYQRDKTLAAFRDGRFRALVATDVAARGLDIPNVDLVIHFEMPNTPDIFLHRSGRTGRAGNKGTTVLMFTEDQRRSVRFIERDLGCKFEELRGITGQDSKMSSDRYYDDSIGRNLWESDDSDDAQDGNYRRFQRSSQGNFRSRGNFGQFKDSDDAKYGNSGRFQRSHTSWNSRGNFRSRSGHTGNNLWESDDSDDTQDGNYMRFQRPSQGNFRSRGNSGQFNDSDDAKYGNSGRFQRSHSSRNSRGNFRSCGGHKGNNFSKGHQSGPAYRSSTISARSHSFDNFNQWNESNDYEKVDSPVESSRSESRPGYHKSHHKKSGSDDDSFDYLRDLF